ncbi:hypothetical protein GCM10010124_33700 [Pilimelia terevasa]|uniref:Nicotinate ribosyltransferase n=1 Tax=Pilimelia terevasa TaxID=53372 RepID=A0A8J3BT64_9ACTN|nr:hypothetical protein [Pilimelia terevasa]GGK38139.1 hypothetical protein GCM10010124_33700 [Pilimelia terevasa]
MSYQLWSWLLTAVGVTGLYLAGRNSWTGWAVGLASQLLWLAYSVTTGQWGFLVSVFAYGAVHARNLHRTIARNRQAAAAAHKSEVKS